MKTLKNTVLLFLIALSLFKCAIVPKLQKEAPTGLKEVYYQNWNAGHKDGISGTDIYIRLLNTSVLLDSVYFKGHVVKLNVVSTDSLLFVGHTKSNSNITIDLENSSFSKFKINDSDCIISYKKTHHEPLQYYKIINVIMLQSVNYPSSPSKI
ncbi:hypothetical protein [Winogradskyella sp. Asnod2-B02-A]|uniref:hypothetical protein n=1 Tax=Winogradskyella sp. Asnod2-B02-A TaxID=3160583 RepID=UPI003870584B